MDRVRFDDNVSFIEASSSPKYMGSACSRASEKNLENSEPKSDSVASLSMSVGVSKSSGASASSGEKRTPKICESTSFTEVDLSGIEISVDITGSLDESLPIEVDQPINLEVSTL